MAADVPLASVLFRHAIRFLARPVGDHADLVAHLVNARLVDLMSRTAAPPNARADTDEDAAKRKAVSHPIDHMGGHADLAASRRQTRDVDTDLRALGRVASCIGHAGALGFRDGDGGAAALRQKLRRDKPALAGHDVIPKW